MSPKLSPDSPPHFQGNAYFIKISTDRGEQWFP